MPLTTPYQSLISTIQSYQDKRLLWVFLLGCSSGFPWVLIGSSMTGWLSDLGLSRTSIGYFGAIASVYALNFLWAPLIDRVKLPFLYQRAGQRRSWILLCQGLIFLLTLLISLIDPKTNLIYTSIIALLIAIASSTHDIAIDAFRIDTFSRTTEESKLPQASAMAVIGWWTGYSLPGYIAFIYADNIGWNHVYWILAGFSLLLMLFTLFTKEPNTHREALQQEAEQRHSQVVHSKWGSWLSVTLIEPFIDFFKKNGVKVALTLLLFVFLFKIGEAFLGRMSIVFYKDIGFTNEQIGYYSKLIGWGSIIVFTFLGSLVNIRFGIIKGLLIGGTAMAASNLMFSWIAHMGANEHMLLITVIVDNFTTAFSTVAFVAFLTLLTGEAFSATQYALLASLGNFGRTTLASFSGELADYLNNWSLFFIVTAIMVLPSLIMLYRLRGYFSEILQKKTKQNQQQKKEMAQENRRPIKTDTQTK